MSELKVIDLGNIRESIEKDEPVYYEYYAKSEADKVIARNKYKRCLAMAQWCETRHFVIRYLQADKISNEENYIGTFDYIRREYMIKHYCRWANKWLELAEEPTWAKFLQLIHKEEK